MDSSEDEWVTLVEAATRDVQRAKEGNPAEGRRVLFRAEVALSNLLDRGAQPSPRDEVYLRAMLESLHAIRAGVKADDALHIGNPAHRPEDSDLPLARMMLFIQVGEELDRLVALGRSRSDAPIAEAIRAVAKKNSNKKRDWKVSVETVKKAWTAMGALDGWTAWRAQESDEK